MESGRAHVGVHAVLQVIEQVQQDERVPVVTADLEDPLHRVAPAAQHLPISRGQLRSAGQEPVQYGLAGGQAVLKRGPVDDGDRLALTQLVVGLGGLEHELFQIPLEPRAEREFDQGSLQFRAALDEGGKRRLAAVVHGPKCHFTSPPRRARPGCG
jgi:hypothetical protein